MLERILAYGLSAFVLTLMLKDLNGPFDIFKILREKLCRYDENYVPVNFFAKLFECPWCLGTWVSAGVVLLSLILPVEIFYWLSAIAIVGMLYDKYMAG